MRGWWRHRTLSKGEVQRLLEDGSGDSPVADLLRAASGPARPGELAGERAAVAAFRQEYAARAAGGAARAAGETRGAPARRVRRSGHRVAVLAAALTVAALAGAGVAAGAGRLPAPLQRAAHDWIEQVPEPGSDAGPRRPEPTVVAASPTPATADQPSVTPAPTHTGAAVTDVKRLCKEWERVRDDPRRKPMDPGDLRALTAAAGGPERIEQFCGLTPSGSASAPGQHGPPSSTKSKKASRP
jgi:hypothetical protein